MKKRLLIGTTLMMGLVAITTASSTFAWFSAVRRVDTDNLIEDFQVDGAAGNMNIKVTEPDKQDKVDAAGNTISPSQPVDFNSSYLSDISGNGTNFFNPILGPWGKTKDGKETFTNVENVTGKYGFYNEYHIAIQTIDDKNNASYPDVYVYLSKDTVFKTIKLDSSLKNTEEESDLTPAVRMSMTVGDDTIVWKPYAQSEDTVDEDKKFIKGTGLDTDHTLAESSIGTYDEEDNTNFVAGAPSTFTEVLEHHIPTGEEEEKTIKDFTAEAPYIGVLHAGDHVGNASTKDYNGANEDTTKAYSNILNITVRIWIEGMDSACTNDNLGETRAKVQTKLIFNGIENTQNQADRPVNTH